MVDKSFILISNQRCGSTWFITSIGNCKAVSTDYEVKWSKSLLIGQPSPYHLFLSDKKIENIFNYFPNMDKHTLYGTKFVFDFYRAFPANHYNKFINKFNNFKIIHITRDYIDILKSKLIGKVIHLLDPKNFENKRLIDSTILAKQKDYVEKLQLSKSNNEIVRMKDANSYLTNLFINDVLTLSLKNQNQYLNLKYEDLKTNMHLVSDFLNISVEDLNQNFFVKPVIKKNKLNYKNNFENYEDLKKINTKFKQKIDFLINNNFDFNKVIFYDEYNKKLNIKI